VRTAPGLNALQSLLVDVEGVTLQGDLGLPAEAPGIVVFAHGSGSSRLSPRNRFVATALQEAGFGTLLADLLTTAEAADRSNVFDIVLLAERLGGVARWLGARSEVAGRSLGFFGASTGAAAALLAAARGDPPVAAVVSRGGRPDLAGAWLERVAAPTLLIVGGRDPAVLELNRRAYEKLTGPKRLEVVPGATHLFEERGTLEVVAALAAAWFRRFLVPVAPA
jgi:putative phosphoribosyl transferase